LATGGAATAGSVVCAVAWFDQRRHAAEAINAAFKQWPERIMLLTPEKF